MRPVKLEFSGLHSYRDMQQIDFSNLTDIGLFGIFGPTGSGKSTVLDAITLALYGKVERAGGRASGIINQAENRLYVFFSFELDGRDGRKRYSVERIYARSDEYGATCTRSTLSIEPMSGTGLRKPQVVAEGFTQVNAHIKQIIGLSVDDFTRAVVLPQGRFAEFLQLRGAERRKMLERLFDLEHYGEALSTKLRFQMASVRSSLDTTAAARDAIGDASPEACLRIKASLEAETERRNAIARELSTALESEKQAHEIRGLQTSLQAARDAEVVLQARTQEVARHRRQLRDAEKAEQARPHLESLQKAEAHHAAASQDLDAVVARYLMSADKHREATEKKDAASLRRQEREPMLLQRRFELERARDIETLLSTLGEQDEAAKRRKLQASQQMEQSMCIADAIKQSLLRITDQAQRLQAEMTSLNVPVDFREQVSRSATALRDYQRVEGECKAFSLAVNEAKDKGDLALVAMNEASERAKDAQDALARAFGEVTRIEADDPSHGRDVSAELVEVTRLGAQASEITEVRARLVAAESLQHQIGRDLQSLAGDAAASAEAVANSERCYAAAKDALSQSRMARDRAMQLKQASMLARTLIDGEPCPVCGATHHPNPRVALSDDEIEQADRNVEEAQACAEAQNTLHTKAVAANSKLQQSLASYAENLERADRDVKTLQERISSLLANLPDGFPASAELMDEHIRSLHRKATTLKEQVTLHAATQKQSRDLLAEQQRAAFHAENELTRCKAEHDARARELGVAILKQTDAMQALRNAMTALDEARAGIPVESIVATLESIRKKDARRSTLEKELESCNKEQIRARQDLEAAERQVQALKEGLLRLTAEDERLARDISEKRALRDSITGGRESAPLLDQVNDDLTTLAKDAEQAIEHWKQCDADLTRTQFKKAEASATLETLSIQVERARAELCEALQKANWRTAEEARACLLPEDERTQIRLLIETFETECVLKTAEVRRLVTALAGRSIDEADWLKLTQQVQTLKQQHEAVMVRVGEITNEYRSALTRREQWEKLETTRKRLEAEFHMFQDLESVLRGNALVDFMAEEQLAAIANDASQRLSSLTRYRYALMLDSEGGFVIRDDHNGGLKRPVSTLSGGETFLTSLALALALSAQVQLRGECPLEFFFLDEGFGTLDPDALETVLDSLDRLRHDRLTIGLISHVPEFKNRISRRIIVEPALPGGSSSLRVEVL